MKRSLNFIWRFIVKHRYLVVLLVFAVNETFSDTGFLTRYAYAQRIDALQADIRDLQERYDHASAVYQGLVDDPNDVVRVARERYFMHQDDEDVFVIR